MTDRGIQIIIDNEDKIYNVRHRAYLLIENDDIWCLIKCHHFLLIL